jgi:hypothetical protein
MVQKASILRQVAEALAGGPRYQTTIDPQSGKATRTALPMSGRDIGMAIALEALSGAAAGAGAKGPNATGQAAAMGLQQGEKIADQRKDQQQQADNTAQQDYARQMQTFHNNLQMLQISKQLSGADFETNEKVAAQYGDLYKEMQNHYAQYILGTGGESDASKYHATSATAVPTGRVIPVLNPQTGKQDTGPGGSQQWQLEYAFIDPSFKGDNLLNAQDKSVLQKYGQQGFVDSQGKPSKLPDNFQLGANLALALKHRAVSLEMSDNMLQDYYKQTGMDPKALVEHMKEDPSAADAMGKFQAYLAQTDKDGRRLNYTEAIGQLGAKDPQAAGQVLNLLGGTSTVSKFDADAANKVDEDKKTAARKAMYEGPMTEATAIAALSDPDASPEIKAKAQGVIKTTTNINNGRAYGEAASRTQGEIDTKNKNGVPGAGKGGQDIPFSAAVQATLSPDNYKTPDGRNHAFIDAFSNDNPELANLVKAYSEGRNMPSFYAAAKQYGGSLQAALETYDPSFDIHNVQAYNKTIQDLTPGGKIGSKLLQGNTAFKHLAKLYDDLGVSSQMHLSGAYEEDHNAASTESANYYSNGAKATIPEIADQREVLNRSLVPFKQREAVRRTVDDILDKTTQTFNQQMNQLPRGFLLPKGVLDPEVVPNIERITGKSVDPRMIDLPSGRGGQIDPATAKQFLQATHGDKDAARKLANQRDWRF